MLCHKSLRTGEIVPYVSYYLFIMPHFLSIYTSKDPFDSIFIIL
jgi:hypothetical protein